MFQARKLFWVQEITNTIIGENIINYQEIGHQKKTLVPNIFMENILSSQNNHTDTFICQENV